MGALCDGSDREEEQSGAAQLVEEQCHTRQKAITCMYEHSAEVISRVSMQHMQGLNLPHKRPKWWLSCIPLR